MPLSRREIAVLGALVLAALALRLDCFTGLHGSDDLTHAYAGAHFWHHPADAEASLSSAFAVNVRRIGVNFPLWVSTSLFGVREGALALVPMLFSLAGLLAAFAALRQLRGELAGLTAAALWAVLPVDVYHAGNWLQDNVFASVLMIAIACAIASEKRPRWAIGAGLALGYLEYVKESAPAALLAVLAWLAWSSWRARAIDRRIAMVIGGFVAVSVLAAIYFAIVLGDPFAFWTAGASRSAEVAEPHGTVDAIGMVGRYLFGQWVFGYLALAFPVLAAIALRDRATPMRVLWIALFVLQLAVLVAAMRIGNWSKPALSAQGAERYNLQLSVPYLVLAVLGLDMLAARVPAHWRKSVAALAVFATALAIDPVHESNDRAGMQVVRDAFVYLDDSAGPRDPIYVDDAPLADADGRPLPDYTGRVLSLLSGYRTWKGGLHSLDEAADATSGWVVITHMEHRRADLRGGTLADAPPPSWLEVFRAERRDGRVWARVFKILPAPLSAPVAVVGGDAAAEAQGLAFVPVDPSRLRATDRWGKGTAVTIAPVAGGADVTVAPSGDADKRQGGVVFDVDGAAAVRVHLALIAPEHVQKVFVHATSANGKKVVRWTADSFAGGDVTLVPGEPADPFHVKGDDLPPADIRQIHVFVQIDGAGAAGFQLRDLAVAAPGGGA